MKHILFIIVLFSNVLIYAVDYPIPASGSKWGRLLYDPGFVKGYLDTYDFRDTTLSNGLKYTVWPMTEGDYSYYNFTRYDSGKVYLADERYSEHLLYDFSLIKKDTFRYVDSIFNKFATYIVTTDTMIMIENGQYRKQLKLGSIDGGLCHELIWIEGIGDVDEGFFYNPCAAADGYFTVACFSDSSGLVYKKTNIPCDSLATYYTAVNSPVYAETTVSLSANNEIKIVTEGNIKMISICSIAGTTLLNTTQNPFSLARLPEGMYFVVVEFSHGLRVVKKVIR